MFVIAKLPLGDFRIVQVLDDTDSKNGRQILQGRQLDDTGKYIRYTDKDHGVLPAFVGSIKQTWVYVDQVKKTFKTRAELATHLEKQKA